MTEAGGTAVLADHPDLATLVLAARRVIHMVDAPDRLLDRSVAELTAAAATVPLDRSAC
ncbi:MAG TPA: hypothetical protein VIU11_05065 [Nakamurella sp.]